VTSLLAERPVTDEERAAVADDPRPGVWAGDPSADLRALTQDQTDALVRRGLFEAMEVRDYETLRELAQIIGEPRATHALSNSIPPRPVAIGAQRGGIDSDPVVRLLAYRAWGDRDRRWFELRGVRKGDLVILTRSGSPTAIAAWPGEEIAGRAEHDARPGEMVEVVGVDPVTLEPPADQRRRAYARYPVSDRERVDSRTAGDGLVARRRR
jgi:hypothetical protein